MRPGINARRYCNPTTLTSWWPWACCSDRRARRVTPARLGVKLSQLDPDSPEIQYNLAFASFQSRDIATSREHAAQAIELWPDFPEANVLFGTILYMLADDARAKAVLTRAHALLPEDPTVNRLLAELSER